ncbi:MAG: hypothetical protein MJY71_08015 [Bacteroidaceae bacterium]|nr:hypothetical protein [Bacteroidaceae bacterium]
MNESERLLRSKMGYFGDNLISLGDALGIRYTTLSRKVRGQADFTQSEMSIIKTRYNLSDEEFAQIFTKEVLT